MDAVVVLRHQNHASSLYRIQHQAYAIAAHSATCIPFARRTTTTWTGENSRGFCCCRAHHKHHFSSQHSGSVASVTAPNSILSLLKQMPPANYGALTIGISIAIAVLAFLAKPETKVGGSVAELVKRGQLRSDRRSDSKPLKYEDPFNNPMVKIGPMNSVVKMYGKMFRVQPVSLTEEKRQSHQNRRVQAYQWRRPTIFLVEGEPIPEGIDPDTVRWIPSNHPFATAKTDIDEVAAEKNIYQTRGVPSRVRAEHEALRRRMREATEKEDLQFLVAEGRVNSDQGSQMQKPFQQLSEERETDLDVRPIKPFGRGDISGMDNEGQRGLKDFR